MLRSIGVAAMQLRYGTRHKDYIPPGIKKLETQKARQFYGDSLLLWLATVALVLIVIGLAFALAAWLEPKKQSLAEIGTVKIFVQPRGKGKSAPDGRSLGTGLRRSSSFFRSKCISIQRP